MIDFLQQNSGKIIAVGDTFDYSRSSVIGETEPSYLFRTSIYWKHIKFFIKGNHDAEFLEDHHKCGEFYRNAGVLAFHGHQLKLNFNSKLVSCYEKRFAGKPKASLFWDVEEKLIEIGNKYFSHCRKSAASRAKYILQKLKKHDMLEGVDTVIVGHSHLPYDTFVEFDSKTYRVANCGSACHGQDSNPVYVESIDKWFVSDLHLGTKKSRLK